jgi:hypothetical protein
MRRVSARAGCGRVVMAGLKNVSGKAEHGEA